MRKHGSSAVCSHQLHDLLAMNYGLYAILANSQRNIEKDALIAGSLSNSAGHCKRIATIYMDI